MVTGIWLVTLFELKHSREQAENSAQVAASNLARAFEESVRHNLDLVDGALLHVRHEMSHGATFEEAHEGLHDHLYGDVAGRVHLVDRDGIVVAGKGIDDARYDISDRSHFQALKTSDKDVLMVSRVVSNRVSGLPMIHIARRVTGHDGSFHGILSIALPPDNIIGIHSSLDLGAKGSVAVVGLDGYIRARAVDGAFDSNSFDLSTNGRYLDQILTTIGHFRDVGPHGERNDLIAYRRLPSYGVAVVVGFDLDEMLAQWQQRAQKVVFAAALVSVVLILSGFAIAGLVRRHFGDRQALSAKAEELSKANAELETLARTDPLTGLANRRHVMERFAVEFRRCMRYGGSFAVIALDIDFFKRVNDTRGHLVGDIVLTKLAERCSGVLREGDLMARTGGEEFFVLLTHTPLPSAFDAAEKLRQAIAKDPIIVPNEPPVAVTISLGVTDFSSDDAGVDQVLARADEALYLAKNKGRNRVEFIQAHGRGAIVPGIESDGGPPFSRPSMLAS